MLPRFNTPNIDLSIGLAEVTKYNIGPGWNQPSSVGGVMINKDAWNTLPPDLKKIIEIAAYENLLNMSTLAEWDNSLALKKWQEKGVHSNQIFREGLSPDRRVGMGIYCC